MPAFTILEPYFFVGGGTCPGVAAGSGRTMIRWPVVPGPAGPVVLVSLVLKVMT